MPAPNRIVHAGRLPAVAMAAAILVAAWHAPAAFGLPPRHALTASVLLVAAAVAGFAMARLAPRGRLSTPGAAPTIEAPSAELAARLERQRSELETLARRLMTVQEDERTALSRELHDDIGQAITAIKLGASTILHSPASARSPLVTEAAHEIGLIADQTVAKLRDLSLLLRPPQLDALGLEAALRWQAGTLFRGDAPAIELDIATLPHRPPREVEMACFRIAQEALTNALRHAAAGRVVLRLRGDAHAVHLVVEDDGRGVAAGGPPGLGLITMRERAHQVGGRLRIHGESGGTRVEAELPFGPDRSATAPGPGRDASGGR